MSGGAARAHVVVHGRVQGVSFRVETRDRAVALGVSGWVRNNPDGTVEAVLEGDAERVRSLVCWCQRGPSGARVERVDVDWQPPSGLTGFAIR